MTIKQKAIAYDKAIKRAKELISRCIDRRDKGTIVYRIDDIEEIFPELKESKDERIRKAISDILLIDSDEIREILDANNVLMQDINTWLEKQCENKPLDKVEPKFHEGDWIIFAENHNSVYQVERIDNYHYYMRHYLGSLMTAHYDNKLIRLWNIKDAKEGDVLVHNGYTFIFVGIKDGIVQAINEEDMLEPVPFGELDKNNDYHPATKEQRETLFAKIKEAGYEWDDEKKELKRIEQSKLTEFEDAVKDMMNDYRDAIGDNDATIEEVKKHAEYLLSLIPYKPAEWSEEDKEIFGYLEDMVNFCYCNQYVVNVQTCERVRQLVFRLKSLCFQSGWGKDDITRINEIIETLNIVQANRVRTQRMHYNKATIDKNIDWLESLKNRVQPKQEWSKEDEEMWLDAIKYLELFDAQGIHGDKAVPCINWLKSLRSQKQWKPSDEQIDVLDKVIRNPHLSTAEYNGLIALKEQLKKL